jgi:NAD(P)-dependent dehydrogenase (short-subunit alcohol dehydrogenase family)
LAEEGAVVVIGNRHEEAARDIAARIESGGGTALACALDISEEESVAECIRLTVQTFGGLDGLHGNAAELSPEVNGRDTDILNEPLEVFDQTLRVNLRGHVLCTRYALPHLLQRGGGSIVYTSSGAAFTGEPQRPAYAISKSGLHALVRHVASRWGKEGIRANAVVSGFVLTEKARQLTNADFQQHWLNLARSPRLGEPDDIAAAVAMLFSDDGAWINGQAICVDGGTVLH